MSEDKSGDKVAGDWRGHLLVPCAVCKELMGYHKESLTAVCIDCERSPIKKK